jgi:hypothetical protein
MTVRGKRHARLLTLRSTPLSLHVRCLCRCIMQPMYMNAYRFLEEPIFWVEATRMLSEYIWAGGIQGRLFDYGACDSAQVWCMQYTRLVHNVIPALLLLLDFNVSRCVCVYTHTHTHVIAVILFYFNVFIHTPALRVLYSYFSCCACVCVCVPAYWPRRVCATK